MSVSLKKYVLASVFFLVVVLGLYYIFVFIYSSSVSVVLNYAGFNPKTARVSIAEKVLTPEGDGANTYKTSVNPGTYYVEISGPDLETSQVEFTTGILENKEIIIDDIAVLSAEEIAESVYSLDENSSFKVFNAKLFDDNTWLAFQVSDGIGNGALVIAAYSTENLSWTLSSDGTDIDFSSQELRTAPDELVRYVNDL